MFRRLPTPDGAVDRTCCIDFGGRSVEAHVGESAAAALLRADVPAFRVHPVDGTERWPYCMMGVCQECLVCTPEGDTARACLMLVREGLRLRPAGVVRDEL
jgi:hypothetical protein